MTKFKNVDQQYIYQLYLTGIDGPNVRNSLQTAFKHGLSAFDVKYEKTSLTYAAWAAGRDVRKARLPVTAGVWCADRTWDGIFLGWYEAFKTDDGRLVTIPGSGRYVTVRDSK